MSLQKDNRAPLTKSQRESRFNALQRIGCVVCKIYYQAHIECHIHHATGLRFRAFGKKAHDLDTFGLCEKHHVYGSKDHPSIHGQPAEFESRFGTQEFLLEAVNQMIEAMQ